MNTERTSNGSSSKSWLGRLSQAFSGEHPQDQEQLIELLRDAERRHVVDSEALTMIEGVLQVGEMQVRDIMVPRPQMVVIKEEQAPEEFIEAVVESGHSRFPVIGDNRDEVEGIALAKDLLTYFAAGGSAKFDIDDVMRPAVFIPESKRLDVLLREFRASRNHMAIVVDEYGGVAGLVTIEDVLEQIVGEIDDEHDTDEESYIKRMAQGEHVVKALTPIEDFNEYFSTDFSDEEVDTVGGLVVRELGQMPRRGDTVNVKGVHFHVLRADKRRVHLLKVLSEGAVEKSETG